MSPTKSAKKKSAKKSTKKTTKKAAKKVAKKKVTKKAAKKRSSGGKTGSRSKPEQADLFSQSPKGKAAKRQEYKRQKDGNDAGCRQQRRLRLAHCSLRSHGVTIARAKSNLEESTALAAVRH